MSKVIFTLIVIAALLTAPQYLVFWCIVLLAVVADVLIDIRSELRRRVETITNAQGEARAKFRRIAAED